MAGSGGRRTTTTSLPSSAITAPSVQEGAARQHDSYLETGVGGDELTVLGCIAPSDVDVVAATVGEPRVVDGAEDGFGVHFRRSYRIRCGG